MRRENKKNKTSHFCFLFDLFFLPDLEVLLETSYDADADMTILILMNLADLPIKLQRSKKSLCK